MTPPALMLNVKINGEERTFLTSINKSLFDVLRDEQYFDVKNGCLNGDCGACAVELDGRPVLGCLVMAAHCEGKEITTPAAIGSPIDLDPIQEAFLDVAAVQCGYCTPGMLIATRDLLRRTLNPTEEEARAALAGNLCRCTGYVKPVEAVLEAAKRLRKQRAKA